MSIPIAEPLEQVHRPRNGLRTRPRTRGNFTHLSNHVYAETDGVGLVMDIFQPLGDTNGHAIVDVVSGAWHADRPRLNEHIGLGAIDAFCDRGFTVFAVAPGSASVFSARQMVAHVQAAIRHIRHNEGTWRVVARPLGLCGVSAGGHIAALAALQPDAADPKARQPWFHHDTAVDAVGLLFPPTDLLDYGGRPFDFRRTGDLALPRMLFPDGIDRHSPEEVEAAARAISPLYQIAGPQAPWFLTHATEDAIVPYSQSERFAAALSHVGTDVTFVTHEGPGHPWPTVAETCKQLAAWFEARLVG